MEARIPRGWLVWGVDTGVERQPHISPEHWVDAPTMALAGSLVIPKSVTLERGGHRARCAGEEGSPDSRVDRGTAAWAPMPRVAPSGLLPLKSCPWGGAAVGGEWWPSPLPLRFVHALEPANETLFGKS